MARTSNPAPETEITAQDDSLTATILGALAAESGGTTAADLAAYADISTAAARKTLAACEKAGTATRIKSSGPGLPDTWKPAEPRDDTPPSQAADTGSPDNEQAAARPGQAPSPVVTADASVTVTALAQAADDASHALAAGDFTTALAALDAAREQAACGIRLIKAATARRSPGTGTGTRPGALRTLVEDHLRQSPETAFTPHQISKALNRSSGAVANALDTLVNLGSAELVTEKPRTFRLAPTASDPAGNGEDTVGTDNTSAAEDVTPSAA